VRPEAASGRSRSNEIATAIAIAGISANSIIGRVSCLGEMAPRMGAFALIGALLTLLGFAIGPGSWASHAGVNSPACGS
jgi:hypothetical protein